MFTHRKDFSPERLKCEKLNSLFGVSFLKWYIQGIEMRYITL